MLIELGFKCIWNGDNTCLKSLMMLNSGTYCHTVPAILFRFSSCVDEIRNEIFKLFIEDIESNGLEENLMLYIGFGCLFD